MNYPDYISLLESWVDAPYLHQGHTREGVDCIGLVRAIYADLGVDLCKFDVPDRQYVPDCRALIRGLNQAFTPICGIPYRGEIGLVAVLPDLTRVSNHCAIMFWSNGWFALEASRGLGRVQIRAVHQVHRWYSGIKYLRVFTDSATNNAEV